jgi:hypothetical protein
MIPVYGKSGKLDASFDHRHFHESKIAQRLAIILRGGQSVPPRGRSVEAADFPTFCFNFDFVSTITSSPVLGKFEHGLQSTKHSAGSILGGGFDWDNVMVAGGSVLQALLKLRGIDIDLSRRAYWYCNSASLKFGQYSETICPVTGKRGRHLETDFQGSDIDVFLYDLTQHEAVLKLEQLNEHLSQFARKHNQELRYVRTKGSFTFAIGTISLQVILRLYKSRPEILMAFDLDSCAVGFDGTTVWALPRACRALNGRFNLVDETRPNVKYEARLFKYSLRGFGVGIPGMHADRSNVGLHIYTGDSETFSGLGKLLRAEMIMAMYSEVYPVEYGLDDEVASMVAEDPQLVRLRQCPRMVDAYGPEEKYGLDDIEQGRTHPYKKGIRAYRAREKAMKRAVACILGAARSWYDAWRMGAGMAGYRDLERTIEEYQKRHDEFKTKQDHGGSGVIDLAGSSDDDAVSTPGKFMPPVLLSGSFETAVHGGSQGSSVPAAITWHVADPTRRYIGGFTAEGVDFYGDIVGDDVNSYLRKQLADAQEQLKKLQPEEVDLTGDGGDDATESSVARASLDHDKQQRQPKPPAKLAGIKREVDHQKAGPASSKPTQPEPVFVQKGKLALAQQAPNPGAKHRHACWDDVEQLQVELDTLLQLASQRSIATSHITE